MYFGNYAFLSLLIQVNIIPRYYNSIKTTQYGDSSITVHVGGGAISLFYMFEHGVGLRLTTGGSVFQGGR